MQEVDFVEGNCDETLDASVALSVVSPFLNERGNLGAFALRLKTALDELDCAYEVILIDDGSTDESHEVLLGMCWPEARVIRLAKNVGHQSAIRAGMNAARGTHVVTMDSDLQHPPELIAALVKVALIANVEVVYAAQASRLSDKFLKKATAHLYYFTARSLTGVPLVPHAADFRLMSRRVVSVVNQIPGQKPLRVLLPALGFSHCVVPYHASPRHSGESKYGVSQMAELAFRSLFDFSSRPLKWIAYTALMTVGLSLLWLAYVAWTWVNSVAVEGWASVMSVVLILGAMQLSALAVMGLYLSRLYDSTKGMPAYLVQEEFSLRREADMTGTGT